MRTSVVQLFALLVLGTGCGASGTRIIESAGMSPQARDAATGGNFIADIGGFWDRYADEIVEGALRDEIPAVTDRAFVPPRDRFANYLLPDDIVMGVVIGREVVAFPHNIGWWHEVMNATVGGRHLLFTYCPLTGSGLLFDATDSSDGTRIRMGVSGLLFNNNLIMYDRRDGDADNTLYPQMLAAGVTGPRVGSRIELMPVVETTWRFWQQLHPDTKVVSGLGETFSPGTYTAYPYGEAYGAATDYRTDDRVRFRNVPPLDENPLAGLFARKDIVLGVRFGEIAKAYPFPAMGEQAVINDTVAGNPLVVVYYAAEKFALAHDRRVDGREFSFDAVASTSGSQPFMLRDRETGSLWALEGHAVEGPMRGFRLRQVPTHNAYWFAWVTFWQNTGIY